MNIYNCCSLCLEEDKNNGDNLIWLEGLQLCEDCYNRFRESDYNARIMPLNAIKRYRRKIADILEEQDKKDCIPKSKIKEKIEEIQNRKMQDGECELAIHGFQREAKIQVLQELLEEQEDK